MGSMCVGSAINKLPVRQRIMHAPPRSPCPPIAALPLCAPHRRCCGLFFPPRLAVLSLFVLLLSSVSRADDELPPVQHHVYYSGSHITSIALQTADGELYATDVVHSRIMHYNSSGSLLAVWSVTETPLYSPTSVAYVVNSNDYDIRLLYVADSTTAAIVKVDPDNGTQVDSRAFSIPSEMWECGVLFAELDVSYVAVYVIDRYRGYVAKLESDQPPLWVTGAPPAAAKENNVTVSYLSALTASSTFHLGATVYIVDGAERVLRMDPFNGSYLDPLVFPLPDFVTGIQAVSWTWCTQIGEQYTGCLWVMYQTGVGDAAETGVVAVSVLNGTVVHSWTVQAAGRAAERADSVTAAADDTEQRQQQAGSNSHVLSPAMRAIGEGTDSDPFLVYLAEADPSGPGHVIVVRDENGTLVRRYDAIPSQYDATNSLTHIFSSVQAEDVTCTLWLTDVDNGGLLVRAAADGTILQSFSTPALFSAAVVDYSSDASSPSLVLLSSNATGWQLWRFHPASGIFVQLNTTAVHGQYNSSSGVEVGGLAVDGAAGASGRVVVSLTSADVLVMMDARGEWNAAFNTTGKVARPTVVTFTGAFDVVAIDSSDSRGEWYLKSFDVDSGFLLVNIALLPPVSQPLALMHEAGFQQTGFLWMADANGLLFQLDLGLFEIVPGGIYRPMPAAYSMLSMSLDLYRTMYVVDVATRRLLMLFLDATGRFRPESQQCKPYPIPPSSSSTSTIFSLSSSSGSSGPSGRGGLLSGIDPLTVAAVFAVVVLVVGALAARYCWLRRRWASAQREDSESDEAEEEEQAAYEQWADADEAKSNQSPYHKVVDEVETGSRNHGAGRSKYALPVDPSDSRYDVYVRLYEALNDAQGDERRWYEAASKAGSTDDNMPQSRGTASTSRSSHSPSDFSSSSSRSRSVTYQSSGDSSGSGSGDPAHTASHSDSDLSHLSSIASISSQVSAVPRFIDCVTDLRILGEGVSGRVYRGYYRGMAVVVKLPKSREMSTAQWREWQAHLRLPPHPNLVSFVGSLVMCDTNYLVLRWVEQGSLKSLLSQPSTSSTAGWYTRPYAILRAAVDVAGALHHVHRHGLVHRDVSARNVLVALSGTFVLADLGLCQEAAEAAGAAEVARPTALASVTRALHTATTTVPLRWCSPDVLSTWRFTSASDVWALGVTLWEMASGGRLPYDECVRQSEMQQLLTLHRARLSLDKHWAEHHAHTDERHITAAVERLIDTCMTVDVERRPTAEQVRQQAESELARWEVEEPEAAQRVRRQWEDEHAKAGRAAAEREREREVEVEAAEREVEAAESEAATATATGATATATVGPLDG